jgi:hypothetical protein
VRGDASERFNVFAGREALQVGTDEVQAVLQT